MKILNLYAGLGGNRKHWNNCQITAVEADPKIAEVYRQQHPEDYLVVGDAHEYLLANYADFDLVWSSIPCQTHSRMAKAGRNRKAQYPDMKLYEEIIFLEHNFKGLWVVENVKPYYTPLMLPTREIGRHLFWANFHIPFAQEPDFPNFINDQTLEGKERLMEWLGIRYEGNIYYQGNHCPTQVLRNCVHPDIGRHVYQAALHAARCAA